MTHLMKELDSLDSLFNTSNFLFSDLFNSPSTYHFISDNSINYPAIDTKYDDDNVYIVIAVTGIDKKDINIELNDNILNVKYDNKEGNKEEKFTFLRKRIAKRSFNLNFKPNSPSYSFH